MIRNLDHMIAPKRRKTPLRYFVFPSLMVILCGVLLVQAWTGDRGLKSWLALKAETAQRHDDLASLHRQNADLRARIERLHIATLDLDYLEERARADLGMVTPNETVIFIDPDRPMPSDK